MNDARELAKKLGFTLNFNAEVVRTAEGFY